MFYDVFKSNYIYRMKAYVKGKYISTILYVSIPILLSSILYFIMWNEGVVEIRSNEFNFLNDWSNSISCVLLFILSYYLCGSYPEIVIKGFKNIVEGSKKKELNLVLNRWDHKVNIIQKLWLAVAIIAGTIFIFIAQGNKGIYWFNNISLPSVIYYRLFLVGTWYFSGIILIESILMCYLNYNVLNNEMLEFDTINIDNMFGQKKYFKVLIMNFAFGIYLIIGAFVIILMDQISYNDYGVNNAFHKYPILIILIVVIVIIGGACVVYSLVLFKNYFSKGKRDILNKIEIELLNTQDKFEIDKLSLEKEKARLSKIYISVMPIFTSIISPLLTVFFQWLFGVI